MENLEKIAREDAIKSFIAQSYQHLAFMKKAESELEELEHNSDENSEKLKANKRMEIRTHKHNYDMNVEFATIINNINQ